jgi:hypothetical protein
MTVNHSVEARFRQAGIRWYEIRRTDDVFEIYQQGTYSPDDGVSRWMGSIAQDQDGNMLLGYSVSDAIDVFPGIQYTGRLAGDELGKMTLCEGTLIDGGGSQQSTLGRWGDYSSMNIDPSDDCTFWYTNEYYETSSDRGWKTRIGSFTMPGCGVTAEPTPAPTTIAESVVHSKGTESKGTKGKGSQKGKGKGYPVSAEIQEGKGYRVRRRDV